MANEEHFRLVKEGKLNAYRKEHPDEKIDLSRRGFVNASLREVNLCNADLRGADLRDADLRGANLFNAKLQEAKLCDADLRGADLCRANLYNADLGCVDLRGATLNGFCIFESRFTGGEAKITRSQMEAVCKAVGFVVEDDPQEQEESEVA